MPALGPEAMKRATKPGHRSVVHGHADRGHVVAPYDRRAQLMVPTRKAMMTKEAMVPPKSPNEPHDQCLHHD